MKCPKCGACYSYWRSWTIWNPKKYICPYCSSILAAGPKGKRLHIASCFIGLLIAAVAIIMEESGKWKMIDSLKYFVIVFPAIAVPWQYVYWKLGDFIERKHPN